MDITIGRFVGWVGSGLGVVWILGILGLKNYGNSFKFSAEKSVQTLVVSGMCTKGN